MIRKSDWLKYMRDQKLTAFIPSASLLSSLPRASLFICFISCCALSRCWNAEHEKKKRWRNSKRKKNLSYILFNVFATLQPSQRFLIQIQFSSCFYPHPFPSFYLSASPLICLFLSIPHPFLLPLWFSSSLTSAPFPHYTSCFRLSSISLLTSFPSVPPSISRNMKGYLCADSQGRRRAES